MDMLSLLAACSLKHPHQLASTAAYYQTYMGRLPLLAARYLEYLKQLTCMTTCDQGFTKLLVSLAAFDLPRATSALPMARPAASSTCGASAEVV